MLKLTAPEAFAEYVNTNVAAAAELSDAFAGVGPVKATTFAAVGVDGTIPTACAPPVFVTVISTVILCPTETTAGAACIAAASTDAFSTVKSAVEPVIAELIAPNTGSVPVALPLNPTTPAPFAEYVYVKTWLPSPGIVTFAGTGPLNRVAPDELPYFVSAPAFVRFEFAAPILFTVINTVTISPTDT